MSKTYYTKEEYAEIEGRYGILSDLFMDILRNKENLLRNELEKANPDSHPFIPRNVGNVLDAFGKIKKYFKEKDLSMDHIHFLDVGCGVGNIMLLAKHCFDISQDYIHGIELSESCKKNALCEDIKKHITICDALEYNNYNEFKIIYYYCPIENSEKQKRLELKIENECKVGTIIIAFLKKSRTIEKDKRFKKLFKTEWYENYHIWIKVKK